MKNVNKVLLVLSGLASLVLFTACGNSTTAANAVTAASCAAGTTFNGTQCVVSTSTTCASGSAWSANLNECLVQTTSCSGQYGISPTTNTCVSLGGTASSTANHSPYQGTCQYGYVQTQDGCLAQGVCTLGYAFGYWGGYPYCFAAVASE